MSDLLKTLFLTMFEKRIGRKPRKSYSLSVLVRHCNRSGVVNLVGRKPLMFAKVENGVTKSCQFFRRKNRRNAILAWISTFLSRIACCARELTSAWHGAFVILKKRWPNKKLFLRRRACTQYYVVLSLNLSYPIGGWSTRSTTRHLELMSGPN